MATGVISWSTTAADNASGDSTVNWAEGQAPSSVNDSARAMMTSVAKWRNDISGIIGSTGTSTAYAAGSYQGFPSTPPNGALITMVPHLTNGANPTLSVDGGTAYPIVCTIANIAAPSGSLIQGTPYTLVFNVFNNAWNWINNQVSIPWLIPVGSCIDFFGTTAPNSSFVLPYGQAISRTTYSSLFSLFSTTYGAGDGSTTFNIPDLRGRVMAGKDDMGGSAANRLTSTYFGGLATNLGATGGAESRTILTANLPPYTPSGSVSGSIGSMSLHLRSPTTTGSIDSGNVSAAVTGGTDIGSQSVTVTSSSVSSTFTGTAQGGTSTPAAIVQPTIVCNKILRII